MATNWQRRFKEPIRLADGTELITLQDAANWFIEHNPPGPQPLHFRIAIDRLMDAAKRADDIESAETAVRLALFKGLDFGR
jgi:hypothetical protein